jgi:hypothetical protein
VDVVVTGVDITATNGFTYVSAPTFTSILPANGLAAGGTAVTLSGTGFKGAGFSATSVTFDGTPAACEVPSSTSITCSTPAHAAGAVDVVVTTPGGSATLSGGYTYE